MKKLELSKNTHDYKNLHFTSLSTTSSSKGCFLKAYDKGIYYKLSNYDAYFKTFGNESIYEVIAYRVGVILGLPTLEYWICKGNIIIDGNELYSIFCASKDFNLNKKKKVNIETIYALEKQQDEDIFKFCKRLGVIDYIYDIILFDYIICNRDRHGANIEFLIDNDKILPTPIFDNGVSFLFSSSTEEDIAKYDITKTPRANNFLGSQDLEFNLSLIKKKITFNSIKSSDKFFLFKDLEDALSAQHRAKILDMLIWRCNHAKEILDI